MKRPAMYSRPKKPMFIPVTSRDEPKALEDFKAPEIITVDRATECHVTPMDVALRMVGYLGPAGDYLTLEPSAGTGQLAKALISTGHSSCELTMIERHINLASKLYAIGPTINCCFLEYAEEVKGQAEFPRIIMNPPFSACKKHIRAAVSLLGKGGHQEPARLVALVPITFEMDGAEELERLPQDTFATAKVHTKIIRFEKD